MNKATFLAAWMLVAAFPVAANTHLPWNFDHKAFAQKAQQLTEEGHTPALAFVMVHRGQDKVVQAYGVEQVRGKTVDEHTVFRLASGSKGFTATAAGIAYEKGKLTWAEKIKDHVPTAKLSDPKAMEALTLYHVLSHQTGLYAYNLGDKALEAGKTMEQIHQVVGQGKLKCAPGKCYSYQNVAFQWGADVIASKTGMPFEQWVEQELFKPLDMDNASFGMDGLKDSKSWARPHVGSKTGPMVVDPKPNYYLIPGAAGINLSARDMSRWLAAQLGHRPSIISQDLLNSIHYPRVEVPGSSSGWRKEKILAQWYGIGWRVWNYRGHRVITHAGAVQGYRSFIVLLPEKDLGTALMWNSQSSKPTQLIPAILDSALGFDMPVVPEPIEAKEKILPHL